MFDFHEPHICKKKKAAKSLPVAWNSRTRTIIQNTLKLIETISIFEDDTLKSIT